MNVKLLDCTLRDGGYINSWEFGEKNIDYIISKLDSANLDIIEIGFYTDLTHDFGCALYSNEDEIRRLCPAPKNSEYAAMIAIGEKEISAEKLPDASESLVDIIRITFHNKDEEVNKAKEFTRILMDKHYKVCMQPVGITDYEDSRLLELLKIINDVKPYAFYIVDTLGVMNKQDILKYLYLIDGNLDSDIKIGFHSHNNLQMSFANAQEILQFPSNREFIIDTSVYGMGRGAGNLCTEIIADYINNLLGEKKYNILNMLEIIDEALMPIYYKKQWGYSAAYFLSASQNCHPNYATELLTKQTLQVSEIGNILALIPERKKSIFDRTLLNNIYISYLSRHIDDDSAREKLSGLLKGRKILLIAPGKTISANLSEIQGFIDSEKPVVISINSVLDFKSDFVFVSNQRRFNNIKDTETLNLIATSNINVDDRKNVVCVDYVSLLNNDEYVFDNSGLMILKLLSEIGVENVSLAGFDGFSTSSSDNYYKDSYIGLADESNYTNINSAVKNEIKKLSSKIKLQFLTPSKYE